MRQRTESAKNEVCFMSVTTATVVVGSTLFAYQLTSNISPICTSAEVVVAQTSVEESPVAEMQRAFPQRKPSAQSHRVQQRLQTPLYRCEFCVPRDCSRALDGTSKLFALREVCYDSER